MSFALVTTQHPGHATELAQRLVEKGERRIIILGGDGTISEVVNATVNSEIELGIISVGTVNDLARSLGLPYNKPEKALEVILTGGPTEVDVGWEAKYTEGIRVPGMEEIDLGEFIS